MLTERDAANGSSPRPACRRRAPAADPPPAQVHPRTPAPPSPSAATGPAPSPSAVLGHLAAAGVPVLPDLSDTELALAEAALDGVQLPPDLRELLALGEVTAALPLAPGRRPGRTAPPPLVPLCGRHYVPATPCLAGNPVLHMSDSGVRFAGANAADFVLRAFAAEPPPGAPLRRQLSAPAPPPTARPPPRTGSRVAASLRAGPRRARRPRRERVRCGRRPSERWPGCGARRGLAWRAVAQAVAAGQSGGGAGRGGPGGAGLGGGGLAGRGGVGAAFRRGRVGVGAAPAFASSSAVERSAPVERRALAPDPFFVTE
ncbi:translation initiation factor IF-2-like [Panicum virgatum]|uniref:translation initiation factor IF-2-like n=1 Tax=Panicum virgatum TaxID=38727 RepID=UPI0019D69EB9|nr:translation initiation factor IF-2-like [Panicum virgatum]